MNPELVNQAIKNMSDVILQYAIALAAVGAFSMVLIEACKSVFKIRDRYHMHVLRNWIAKNPISVQMAAASETSNETDEPIENLRKFEEEVYRQLLLLCTGYELESHDLKAERLPWAVSYENALFSLELEKMMGQIQDAADTVMSNPNIYSALYFFLTVGGNPNDIDNWGKWASQPPVSTSEDRVLAKEQSDTYARLRQLVRRRLDALQLTAAYQWRTLNQFSAVAVSGVMLFMSFIYLKPFSELADNLVPLALVSFAGGIMAPVAKDLVVALKRVRSGG